MKDISEDFAALDFTDFASLYLEDKGILAKRADELNEKNTDEANSWATKIFNDIRSWFEKRVKEVSRKGGRAENPDHNDRSSEHKVYRFGNYQLQLKIYRIGSYSDQEVPVVDVILTPRQKIQINIYDSESVLIKFSPILAKKLGEDRNIVVTKEKASTLVTKALSIIL